MATSSADTDTKPITHAPAPAAASTTPTEPKSAPVDAKPATAKASVPVERAAKVAAKPAKPAAKRVAKTLKPAAKPARPIISAAKAAVTRATDVASTLQKEAKTMVTKFETPKLFTDVNDRAKSAFDKSGKFVSEIGDFNKGNVEALVESTRIAAKGIEALGQDTAEYGRKSFEGLTATLKRLSAIKSPTDFFKLQGDYMRTSFDAAVAQGSKNTEAMLKLAGDAVQPISSRFAVAVEKVKAAA